MPIYNRNDFYPRTGDEIKSDGTVANEADGIDTDGSQFVKDKANAPVLLDTIPYTAFTANTTLYRPLAAKLNRNAKRRSFIVYNAMDQDITNGNFTSFESTISGSKAGESTGNKTFTHGYQLVVSGASNPSLNGQMDSVQLSLPMGTTAPTTGNVYVYLIEVF